MHALVVSAMILCGPVGMVNGFRRTTGGFGVRVTPHGHVAPISVAIFSVLAAMVYHVIWSMTRNPGLVTLVGGVVAALCVASTITLLFYDPALPRQQAPVRRKA